MARASRKKRSRLAKWAFVAILIVLILTVRLVEDIGHDQTPLDRFTVVAVLDGDTVELKGGDRLRLLSIDTPEEGEPYHEEAREFLADLALGETANIEFANTRRDKYGRLLGYLYIDTLFVNKAILLKGLGNLYLFQDTDLGRPETGILLSAQREAIQTAQGIWSVERAAEDYYIAKDNSFRFHRPGCRSVVKLNEGRHRTFKVREEALLEGLSPCRNCKP